MGNVNEQGQNRAALLTIVANRTNHPTIKDAETGNHVIDKFDKLFEEPSVAEGFVNVEVYTDDSTDDIVNKIIDEQVKYKLTHS